MCKYHPIFCIIPPHMLREIVARGTPEQQAVAQNTLSISGQIRGQREAIGDLPSAQATSDQLLRNVYNANNGTSLPGTLARGEGDPATGDLAVDEAYDGSGATYTFFKDIYQRNSIDDNGMSLESTVHYEVGMDNAFWNGQQMVYGDGDENLPEAQRLFNRFTIAIDIIAHELGHGVTQKEANLTYAFQPGALNESFSDVFGALVKQHTLNQEARDADWIIGGGLFTANVNGEGIRNMKSPGTAYDDPVLGKDPQPAHMDGYKVYPHDNGGVHINSGIPNRAFYLTAYEMGGFAWEKAGQIWYKVLRDRLNPASQFQDAANETYTVAGEMYGVNSLEQQAVKTGWQGVGINVGAGEPIGCPAMVASLFGIKPPEVKA